MADEKDLEKNGDASPDEKAAAEAAAKAEADAKTKADADAKAKASADAKAKENAVPEKYDLKLPEGSLLDADALKRTADFAKSQGLSNKAAQALIDRDSQVLASNAESQKKQLDDTVAGWAETAKNDKEYGGAEFPKNAELAKRVVDRFGSAELRKGLVDSGFGNHPELVRLLVKIGKAMSEDQLIMPGSKSAATGKSMEEKFYPSTSNNKE